MVIPLLKFYFHDGVRSSAAEIVPHLLRCVGDKPHDQFTMWKLISTDLLIATEAEPESEVKSEQLLAIAATIEIVPPDAMDS